MLKIENSDYAVTINPHGAELSGVFCKKNRHEYLWQGDPAVWSGRSPILFPVVGKLKNDVYTYNGQSYSMEKHGFARREDFTLTEQAEQALTLTFADCDKHRASYPFEYSLDVSYRLSRNVLNVCHRVTNRQQSPIYFSLGAHPGFFCKPGVSYLEFERDETVQARQLDESILISDQPVDFLNGQKVWPLQRDTFLKDAYILEGLCSGGLWVRNPATGRDVKASFGGAPYLGLWAKPGADYVCVEPWLGLNDDHHQTGRLEDKKGIVALDAGRVFSFEFSIEMN